MPNGDSIGNGPGWAGMLLLVLLLPLILALLAALAVPAGIVYGSVRLLRILRPRPDDPRRIR